MILMLCVCVFGIFLFVSYRYDPTGKGYLTLSEFREKLELDPTAEIYGPVNTVSLNSSCSTPAQTEVSLKDME